MGKKREREEHGRGRKREGASKKGNADSVDAKSVAQDAAEAVSPYQRTRFAGKMVVVTCLSVVDRIIAPELARGQAWANPKRDSGHRCTACGKDIAAGHIVVRVAGSL